MADSEGLTRHPLPMRLYDTARQDIVPFEPGPVVTMYTCGITPYDATHLGHAATFLTYDVLRAGCSTSATTRAACATSPTSTTRS